MKKIKLIYILILILPFILLFLYYQNNNIVVSNYIYKSNKIPNNFNNYKIIQISDLHNDEFGKNNKNLIKIINKEKPDSIFITGDLIDRNKTNLNVIKNLLKNINFKIYFVTGNHEYSSSKYENLKDILNKYNVYILENNYIIIKVNEQLIELYGINDPSLISTYTDTTDIKVINDEIKSIITNNNNFKILLSHRPELINEYANYNFDLVFTGHAHGGQIRLPFIGGLYSPHQGLFPKYTTGYYELNNTTMYVSRGLGNSSFPQRLFNKPEVVVVTLKNK